MKTLSGRLEYSARDSVCSFVVALEGRMRAQELVASVEPPEVHRAHRKNPELRHKLMDMRLREFEAGKLVSQLVDAEGDKAVGFLLEVARNPELLTGTRRQAVLGFGLLGTEKAVNACVKLREEAFKRDWAPEPKEQYTHAERIAEAAIMTINVIPDDRPPFPCADPGELTLKSVYVSEDYATASIRWCEYSVDAKRFGAEWLVVKAVPIAIP